MTVKELAKISKDGLIPRAFEFAKKAHSGQKRESGVPYFEHALATAEDIYSWRLDEASVVAALLHDVVEDTGATVEDIKKEFGEEVAFLVDGVTKISRIKYRGVETQVENLRKMLLALSQDIRVVLVKLADRLHNMKTLNYLPQNKQKRIALETMEIFAPLAYRLGMQKLSGELEDLAFPYIYPREYAWLTREVKMEFEKREQFAEKLKPILKTELEKSDVKPIFIDSRAKRYASLYKKLLRHDMDLGKIHDLVALRVIVGTLEECYAALGVVHKMWPPLPGRIKDYIAMPKPNGYRSLHTTVFCLGDTITEIQIKTLEMHEENENGIAAHWAYEEGKGAKDYVRNKAISAKDTELLWVQQLRNWQKDHQTPEDFLTSLKIDFFKDRIFAITPKGEVIDLPYGATPVDFAYQIHSDIGDACSGARVNGKIVALNYGLNSGDIVEIITQKNKKPSDSWLDFVKTASAREKIKNALKGTSSLLARKSPDQMEFRIVVDDRVGLLKDISAILSRSHVNILSIASQRHAKFQVLKIVCDVQSKEKTAKLMLKLKEVKEVKELNCKIR